jgi:hypothetical protein
MALATIENDDIENDETSPAASYSVRIDVLIKEFSNGR